MIIDARFNGPPETGNGGYSSGLLAVHLLASHPQEARAGVEVTLRKPPPLETELTVRTESVTVPHSSRIVAGPDSAGPIRARGATMLDGEAPNWRDQVPRPQRSQVTPVARAYAGPQLIAEATPHAVGDDEVVAAVPFDEAVAVSASYPGFAAHPFPTCFVCGPARPARDGLGLFPGMLPDGRTAAPFVVPDGVSTELVWASLDCPGGWAVPMEARPYVLGRMTARVDALPSPGDECVVMGLMLREEGRKAFVRTTLYSPSGQRLATARATWVAL